MKLEVGMYVRMEKGLIDKLNERNIMIYEVALMGLGEKPIKASYNIIDLLKVGDYVNGFPVNITSNCDEDSTGFYINTNRERVFLDKPSQIETVITKEMYETIAYKVGE